MRLENELFVRKTGYLTCILLLLFYSANILFTSLEKTSIKSQEVDLNSGFENTLSQGLGEVSIALTSNIGTRLQERQKAQTNIYQGTFDIGPALAGDNSINKELISKNMYFVQDYLNLVKTDVLGILDETRNRKDTLETFIDQLQLRYEQANFNLKELSSALTAMQSLMSSKEAQINSLKTKIDIDFKAFDAISVNEDVDQYFLLREEYTYARTHIIFINQFVKQYNFLNNYNKLLLDTLINNKSALINDSFVVIPDSGDDLLRKLNLIFDEAEFKAQGGNQE